MNTTSNETGPRVWPLVLLPLAALFLGIFLLAWNITPRLVNYFTPTGPATLREVTYREGLFENEKSVIDLYKHARPSVVNVTSIAGSRVHPYAGVAYAASKAALAALTREMASDFGRLGVRVNSIAPGEIDTSILTPGTEKIVEQQIPMHRLGTPDEVAKIIYVLCTDTSSYVNGAEIHINGGQHV